MSDARIVHNPEQSRYEAYVGDELIGIADYRLREGVIDFVHTEVEDREEGRGVGSTLAREALDDVRRDGTRKVIASCPFIAKWIEENPGYQDLLEAA